MSKQEYIEYWKQAADKDWVVVTNLFEKANYPHSLFFAHLVLEKLLKAHFVKDNENDHPPRTHNLVRLASLTQLTFSADDLLLLDKMNDYQMEGRYPDYQFMIFKICDQSHTETLLQEVEKIRLWLLNQLP
ncbi:MAG: HEPN domain-containing protein [Saprospiraceae bacterium]|nr:HEPN domain-containing protein [Lewinellaceae bacterium]MBP6811009.1 HEPN domain-containing protein [Saprospiraceae bacterium]